MEHTPQHVRYRILVGLYDRSGAPQAQFHLERTGADATATAVSHHLWAASRSELHIHIHIEDVPPARITDPIVAV